MWNRHVKCGVMWGLALVLTVIAWPASGSAQDQQILDMANRVLREANRQRVVQQRTQRVIDQLEVIYTDLHQNDLLDRGNAEQLAAVAQTLRRVHGEHVPQAAAHLQEARRQLQAMRPSLGAAGDELDVVVNELERIMSESGVSVRSRALTQQLRLLIDQEQRLHEQTRDWGRESLSDPATAAERRDPIADRQGQIAEALEQFEQRLAQSREDSTDPLDRMRMERAAAALERGEPGRRLTDAANAVRSEDPFTAMENQQEALRVMQSALEALEQEPAASELDALRRRREQVEQLLARQTELREQTEAADAEAFAAQRREAQADQRNLERETGELARNSEAPAGGDPDLQRAERAMQDAQEALGSTDQPRTGASQRQAEAALSDALNELDRKIAQAEARQQLGSNIQEQIDQLRRDQGALNEQSQQAAQQGGDMAEPKAVQEALGQEAGRLQNRSPSPQTSEALQDAQQAMNQAAQAMQQGDTQGMQQSQAEAMAALDRASAEAAAAMQKMAEMMNAAGQLSKMMQQQQSLMNQTAQAPNAPQLGQLAQPQGALGEQAGQMGQMPSPMQGQMGEAAQAMAQAAQALQAGQQGQAGQSQQAAMQALQSAQAAMSQAMGQMGPMGAQMAGMMPGMQPGMQPGMGPQAPGMAMMPGQGIMPGMGQAPGTAPGIGLIPGQRSGRDTGMDPPGGSQVGGADPEAGNAAWQTLGPRQRQELQQRFARELPLEYRQMLEVYYESLAE